MHVQLWSYNYDPEPTGIGPVSTALARGLLDLGHRVDVVAAHPHYPSKQWGRRTRPYREYRDGIPVIRLPLWIGRESAMERYRQELTFMMAQFTVLPILGRPDVIVSTSPSFPALLPALANVQIRRLPWLLWLQDILPDGAASTGIVKSGFVLDAARRLERAVYERADRIVVVSGAFVDNLATKQVSQDKVEVLRNPATRVGAVRGNRKAGTDGVRILAMGNIGFSQGLAPLVEAYERSEAIEAAEASLIITGTGVAVADVERVVTSDRVKLLGVVNDACLEEELVRASFALVSQQHDGFEFNVPSKIMNFMAYGLPVIASVNPGGEVAQIVQEADAGWVIDSSRPDLFPTKVMELGQLPDETIAEKSANARRYAERHFSRSGFAMRFEKALRRAVTARSTA